MFFDNHSILIQGRISGDNEVSWYEQNIDHLPTSVLINVSHAVRGEFYIKFFVEDKSNGVAVFESRIIEIDQITFNEIEQCVAILKIKLDHDKLFEEMINLQTTFKEIVSYRVSLFGQIQKYVDGRDFGEIEETDEEEGFVHKTSTPNHPRIRPD